MGHDLPAPMKKIFFKQLGGAIVLSGVLSLAYRYWDKQLNIPRREDFYKQLAAGNTRTTK
eukprot:TRINITY_DN34441_c0_g1_i1.p1 TRINITY_DN34441_c0_g1~~TRINITY_DN34441_c0_g1_i1.p1  ORF type:complete len:60 (-),score=18.57 TRINITY_DN34441_c0_g1_i1:50-229(-)